MTDSCRAMFKQLRIPAMQAPMFLISGPDMVIAACRAGIIGSFPAPNARSLQQLDEWYARIQRETEGYAPWAADIIVHPTYPRREQELELLLKYQPKLVVTALGSPKQVLEQIHGYGGWVFADVVSPRLARKAVDAGVDGLVLLCAGAGGHTGHLSPFVFVEEVRRFFDGPLIVGGGIGNGRAIHAVEMLGADLSYLGTSFIATVESKAVAAYKEMVVGANADDIVASAAITGVPANWLRQSLTNGGYNPEDMPPKVTIDFTKMDTTNQKWRDLWSAGQCVGTIDAVEPLADVVARLTREYDAALGRK